MQVLLLFNRIKFAILVKRNNWIPNKSRTFNEAKITILSQFLLITVWIVWQFSVRIKQSQFLFFNKRFWAVEIASWWFFTLHNHIPLAILYKFTVKILFCWLLMAECLDHFCYRIQLVAKVILVWIYVLQVQLLKFWLLNLANWWAMWRERV